MVKIKIYFIKGEKIFLIVLMCVMIGILGISFESNKKHIKTVMPLDRKVIVLDAGHGGFDPGKSGSLGLDEQYINLNIVKYLQMYIEQSGAIVFLTRNDNKALGENKSSDMKERMDIINECSADILISIHQNSFSSQNAKGSQVFYFNESVNGELLANKIQDKLVSFADNDNKRLAKLNSDYYILKNSNLPSVLVECGFLSNPEEEKKLNTEEYQKKIAWSIYLGIVDYFKNSDII